MSYPCTTLLALLGVIWSWVPLAAQPLGEYRWQLLPHCNVLTLNVTHQNGIYIVDGTDDRCGAAQAASAVGVAFLNPNGSVGFGITTVLPGGTPLHLEAAMGMGSLRGTWRDSAGNTGSFVLTRASTGGTPRPGGNGVVAASIEAVHLADGAVGPSAIAPNAIVGGHIVDGSLTGADLANETVGAAAIAHDAITGGHVVDGSLTRADIADAPRVMSAESIPIGVPVLDAGHTVIREIVFVAPATGSVLLNASGAFSMPHNTTIDYVFCSLTTGLVAHSPYAAAAEEWTAANFRHVPFGGTRAFSVAAGSTTTFRLVCHGSGPNVQVLATLTALFVAGP